jgi:capsule polysaccharide export protein KpsE/RkpR
MLAMRELKENKEQRFPKKLSMDRIAKIVMIILILTMIYQLYLG